MLKRASCLINLTSYLSGKDSLHVKTCFLPSLHLTSHLSATDRQPSWQIAPEETWTRIHYADAFGRSEVAKHLRLSCVHRNGPDTFHFPGIYNVAAGARGGAWRARWCVWTLLVDLYSTMIARLMDVFYHNPSNQLKGPECWKPPVNALCLTRK